MNTNTKRVGISVLVILAACFVGAFLLFLNKTNASYIWILDQGKLLDQTYLIKMCPNGTRIINLQFGQSGAIGIDPRGGSIWAPELNDRESVNIDQVVQVSADGTIVDRYQGYRTGVLAVDPNDGSVWIGLPNENQIEKLNSTGERLLQIAGFPSPASIVVDPRDSSVWVADYGPPGTVVHLASDGAELYRTDTPGFFSNARHQIAVDPRNGDIWYTGFHSGYVYKRSSAGDFLTMVSGFDRPVSVSIHPVDGSVWVADYSVESSGAVVRLESDGRVAQRIILDAPPNVVGINPFSGSVWVGIDGAVLELSDEGEILQTFQGFTGPHSIAFVASVGSLEARLRLVRTCYEDFASVFTKQPAPIAE